MKITFSEFLDLVKTIRSVYGYRKAKEMFEKNLDTFPQLSDIDITNLGTNQKSQEK